MKKHAHRLIMISPRVVITELSDQIDEGESGNSGFVVARPVEIVSELRRAQQIINAKSRPILVPHHLAIQLDY